MALPFHSKYDGYYLADEKGNHLDDSYGKDRGIRRAQELADRCGMVVKVFRAYGRRFPERLVFTAIPKE